MNTNSVLGGLLAVQVLLAAVTWWPTADGPAPTPIVPYASDAITNIRIESTSTRSRGKDLELRKTDDGWVLASAYDFPVVQDKVTEMLESLSSLRYRNPMSVTAVRHDQLNVGDEKPTRRLTLTAGDQSTTVLIGAATGKRMNVRYPDQDEVYQVEGMGAWALADGNAVYTERERVVIDKAQLTSVSLKRADTEFELTRDGDAWTLLGLEEGLTVDQGRVNEFLSQTATLAMANPADPLLAATTPLATYSWTLQDGSTGSYRVVGRDEDALVLEAEGSPPFIVASALTNEQLEDTLREDFIAPPAEEAP